MCCFNAANDDDSNPTLVTCCRCHSAALASLFTMYCSGHCGWCCAISLQIVSGAGTGKIRYIADHHHLYINAGVVHFAIHHFPGSQRYWNHPGLLCSITRSLLRVPSYFDLAIYYTTMKAAHFIVILLLLFFIIIFGKCVALESHKTFASGLVSKTTELKRERKRCDRLLCQMLPKAVVRQLKQRKQVYIYI